MIGEDTTELHIITTNGGISAKLIQLILINEDEPKSVHASPLFFANF